MHSRVFVSVVIPNWNGKRFLAECLGSVFEECAGDFEVILVDNGSRDGSVDWTEKRFPQVRLIRNAFNRGFAGAVNQGFRAASGNYCVALNNDTRVGPGWLEHLVDPLVRDERVGAACSRVVFYDDPGRVYNAGIRINSLGEPRNVGFGEPFERHGRTCRVDGACACSAVYRRVALEEAGYFDERFFAYHEDVDLSWRLRKAGWEIVYAANSIVYHHGSGATEYLSSFARTHSAKNLLLMNLKNGSPLHMLLHLFTCAFRYGGALRDPVCFKETLRLVPVILKERFGSGSKSGGR